MKDQFSFLGIKTPLRKEKIDKELLQRYILMNAKSKEFFMPKAIGWSFCEYSKTHSASVKNLINDHHLAKLTVREGSKYI
ncbi:DNA alkylation repair protein [Bacillaceae bacterium S4-13-56]